VSLGTWSGKVLLVVNTASECGYTPQYEGLEKLHEAYEKKGFAVLGFPSNDFGGQEPGSSQEIATFCKSKYGVTFPMFEKVATKGAGRADLYARLGELGEPKWNFHKYLVDKHGVPLKAFPSSVKPDAAELTRAIDELLAAP
jgi:glutathione peroxidase